MSPRKKSKPSSSLLSHKGPKAITAPKSIPKSLKPLRARQLIRRFHILIKYKNHLLIKLKTNDEGYMSIINSDKRLKKIYGQAYSTVLKKLEVNKTPKLDISVNATDAEGIVLVLGNIDAEIEKRGGLETYQRASTLGQDGKRGGDSSKILIEWLNDLKWKGETALELGCLSCKNAISTSKAFNKVERIDLNSQEPGIIEQDFLKRPLPKSNREKFDLISCSLVLNFVPNSELRGDMIKLFPKFLRSTGNLLFLVLPLPCVENSRYMSNELLIEIMSSQGFAIVKQKTTHKLIYLLFKWNGKVDISYFKKKHQIRTGSHRNNFSIVL